MEKFIDVFGLKKSKKLPDDELYVMLMLMRASEGSEPAKADCEDPMIKAACLLDSDKCPAECKGSDENKTDEKVKSGDLAVSAKSAPSTKVLATGIADLDTITFKTSEDVEISKITLERYGYSKEGQIKGVWLEDEDGNIIADSKTLSKDKVTLNLKKNYRTVDGKFEATVVVQTEEASGTIGFKVTAVESTAKNLNLDDYSPYTYEVVDYKASEVTLQLKGSDKTYNYEEGNSYEIARLKVKAGTSDMIVKGFTLTNAGKVDMKESLDKLTIKVDSEKVDAKYSVNKDDELVITFSDEIEIKMNKNATFVLEATFKDFDDYGESVQYYIAEPSDFNAVESKNGTRVNIPAANNQATNKTTTVDDVTTYDYITTYKFNGGKIKLSNKKLGNVDAAQGSEGIVVAEGDITVTEPISKVTFDITAKGLGAQYIKNMYFVVDGDEYDNGTITNNAGDGDIDANTVFTFPFKDISIEKSGKIQIKVDIKDPTEGIPGSPAINFITSINGTLIAGDGKTAKYDNVSKQYVQAADVAGSISFSKVTIQAAKAALENNLSKNVEFVKGETSRKVVFDGKYTAKKGGDIDLNKFFIQTANEYVNKGNNINKVTFYLFIDGEEVADTDIINTETDPEKASTESFSDIRVKAGDSVKVKVEAEVEAYGNAVKLPTFRLFILGTDMSGNENTGKGEENLKTMEVKAKGSVTIPATKEDNTALLKAQNATVAKFTVKPSNSNEGITLEDLQLAIVAADTTAKKYDTTAQEWVKVEDSDLRVKVGGVEYDLGELDNNEQGYSINEEIPTSGIDVEVTVKPEVSGKVVLNLAKVNGKEFNTKYAKFFVPSLVTFVKQDEGSSSTEYTLRVEHFDDAYSVNTFDIYSTCDATTGLPTDDPLKSVGKVNDEDTFTILRGAEPQEFCAVVYTIAGGDADDFEDVAARTVTITKKEYKDYFRAGGKELAVPKA